MTIEEAISALKTYQEMNETIKDLLRRIEEPMSLYILARIEELERQASRAPAWISVKDRLPEEFAPVIVCRKGGKVESGMLDVNGWWKVYGTRTKNVTHWMPMPEPPEVE